MKIQKLVGTVILLAGVALLIVGLTLQVPGTYLTTYASLDGAAIDGDTASSIREYVGGDAYNYIIGASLVGAKISGLIMTKAVYTAAGVLVICLGLICLFCGPKEPHTKKRKKPHRKRRKRMLRKKKRWTQSKLRRVLKKKRNKQDESYLKIVK